MATPAAGASIAAPTPTPAPASAPASTPANKKDFPTPFESLRAELAAKGKQNTQYYRLLNGIVRAYTNPIEQAKKEELVKRMIEEAKIALENPQATVKKKENCVRGPGIEQKVSDLTERVNNLIGKICEVQKTFESTKKMDDLQNVKIKESGAAKDAEPKLVDRNLDKIVEFISKNNELMNDFVKLYKTLNHKIALKTKLIAGHIKIEASDEPAVTKFKKKWHLKEDKVREHFAKQEATLKRREDALKHLNLLNSSITEAFSRAQKEIHFLVDCWVNKAEISRNAWRSVGNKPVVGYSTDQKRLDTMYRIENIKNLLPKPVSKPAAAEKDLNTGKKEEKKEQTSAINLAPAAATPAAAAPVNTGAEEKKKKKKKKGPEVEA